MTTKLDDKGRCCGKKPLTYKRDGHKFCTRCFRAFDLSTGDQVPNWAWKFSFENGELVRVDANGDPIKQ